MSAVVPREKLSPEEEARMQSLTAGIALLPIFGIGILLNAYVVLLFWNWFVVPLGLKPLGYWHALGLSVFISFLRYSTGRNKEYPKDARGWKDLCREAYVAIIFFWIIGWLVHLLMQHAGH